MTLMWVARVLRFLYVVLPCATLSGCMLFDFMFDPPGKGPTAERGYAMSAPIIEALERYYVDNSRYPETLKVLRPKYVEMIPEQEIEKGHLAYFRRGQDYELSFTYGGPGMNTCIY